MDEIKDFIENINKKIDKIEDARIENLRNSTEGVDVLRRELGDLKNRLDEFISKYNDAWVITKNYSDFIEEKKTAIISGQLDIGQIVDKSNDLLSKLRQIDLEASELKPKIIEVADSVADARGSADDANDVLAKVNAIYKTIITRRTEIESIFYELNGQDEVNSAGDTVHVDGLIDQLKKSYSQLNEKTLGAIQEFGIHQEITTKTLIDIEANSEAQFAKFISTSVKAKDIVLQEIRALLPNALTAGLSSAYNQKRIDEEAEAEKQKNSFKISIISLTVFAIIPVLINIYFYYGEGVAAEVLLKNFPYLMCIILPIYIPALWVANSANKKINLSKRLIEEYSHKEVLSKTFEGLSNQISEISLSNPSIAEDLRIKLLYNLLDVSAENPGKLISDYRRGDHPLMDALEKSSQLTDAFEKLAKLPGFGNLAKKLSDKAESLIVEQTRKAEAGINFHSRESEPNKG